MNPTQLRYFVFMTMDASKPLDGTNPRGGQLANYNTLAEAKSRAEEEGAKWQFNDNDKWDRLLVCERSTEPGHFTIIERYWKGKKDNW